ncbi:hypothetical protein, conserved [Eimeria maxima]|uniref:Transmembrane protein n=1 Tax=Eimeria maxima TaxID=5804 RepID=U6M6Q9_EIMMA|nr:hypothetical protein, conserved [Eimeria maxima]CDJ58129.1 hypothetical protein, conserved [Eimeria maxima]
MKNSSSFTYRGVSSSYLFLFILFSFFSFSSFLLFFSPSSVIAIRTSSNPTDSTVESSVTFANEEGDEKETQKDVPIKPHQFKEEEEGSSTEGESGVETPEETAESKAEKPPKGAAAAAAAPAAAAAAGEEEAAGEEGEEGGEAAESASEAATAAGAAGATAAESAAESSKAEGGPPPPSRGGAPPPPPKKEGGPPQEGGAPALKEESREETQVYVAPVVQQQQQQEAGGPPRGLGKEDINKRLKELGAPFTLGNEHFSVEFSEGLLLSSSSFDDTKKREGILHRGVYREPTKILTEKSLFIAIDIDDYSLAHADFFNDANGKFAAIPSWQDFSLVSHKPGEEEKAQVGAPLIELPAGATAAEKAAALRISRETNEEIDGVSTPEHGGESPMAGGQVSPSTIFKYVLASLLLIGLIVGVAVTLCPCGKASS